MKLATCPLATEQAREATAPAPGVELEPFFASDYFEPIFQFLAGPAQGFQAPDVGCYDFVRVAARHGLAHRNFKRSGL